MPPRSRRSLPPEGALIALRAAGRSVMELVSAHACFGGEQRFYKHDSAEIGLPMRFGLFMPPHPQPQALLVFLAGLTCNEETFAIKAGAQRLAAELGLAILTPDTSPRGAELPTAVAGEADSWDFGVGAGFYLDATEAPWATHWRMESYLTKELLPLVQGEFNLPADKTGIFGHSMGGHGALTLALRHPHLFKSVSAFAPIAAPSQCAWGRKAFSGYLGDDQAIWAAHDAAALMGAQNKAPFPAGILVDQGLADKFLADQLFPESLESACRAAGQGLTLRRHSGYDHGYFFIASFVDDHLRHHATQLLG